MKACTTAILSLLAGSTFAFAPTRTRTTVSKTTSSTLKAVDISDLPGAIDPMGPWDPLGFAEKADIPTMKRYREAEVTHGRVAMLAVLGFLVGEAVAGNSLLFDGTVTGPAITHLSQIPNGFWIFLVIAIGASEQTRATIGWVEPEKLPVDQPGKLREDYVPGDIGFDPLGLKPVEPAEMWIMQTKELQNGRLAMLAAAGFMAQELVNGKGILENLQG
ncbi:fucoxanthin chlorophyll a/c protein [Nitzschia inconspicua]|uniref:Chlorophyll A-B binding protein n=1 Tax=Nitzschia inconspicua TaxID=303405 RepID=A0A9K3K699_9STRA|nr:chlorophyll A-B binding protein [Nitzschia inconspicua]KAG7371652.1 fucoxanthin chlorophyll a/c protein [Nitzschia inconspicua]